MRACDKPLKFDDLPRNTKPVSVSGMRGIGFHRIAEMRAEIEMVGYTIGLHSNAWNAEILGDWMFETGYPTKEEAIFAAYERLFAKMRLEAL